MTRLLQSPWVIALAGCLVYLATTAAVLRPEQFAMARPAAEQSQGPSNDPSWRFRNPEFEQSIEELRQERESLATRQQQLNELQARLEAERQEILTVTQAVHQLQVDFDKSVIHFKEQETENLRHQVKIIAGMSPEGAATMLSEMPQEQMVRVLFSLKTDAAALILDALSKMGKPQAKLAADIAERLRLVMPNP